MKVGVSIKKSKGTQLVRRANKSGGKRILRKVIIKKNGIPQASAKLKARQG